MATNQTMRTCNRCGTQFPETTEFFVRDEPATLRALADYLDRSQKEA